MNRLTRCIQKIALAAPLALAGVGATPTPAAACPPGCPSPVHPCCCPTPCPTFDGSKVGKAETINKWVNEQLDILGNEIPAFDLAGSPLSCLAGGGGAQELADASAAADLSHIGTGLGPTGFNETPFSLTGDGSTAGLGDMFPIGQAPGAITDGMMNDLSDMSGQLGLDGLASDVSESLGDFGGLTDFTSDFSLSGITTGTGSLGGLNELFPAGEGLDALTSGMSSDLSKLGSDLGLDTIGTDLGLDSLSGKMSSLVSDAGGDLSQIFPIDDGISQITQGMSDDLGNLLDETTLPTDGGLDGILSGDFGAITGGGTETAGLGDLFPVGEGLDTISSGMANDLGALQRDLGLSSGGSLNDYLAVDMGDGPEGNRFLNAQDKDAATGSLQDLFPVGEGMNQISSGMSRDLGLANMTSRSNDDLRMDGVFGGAGQDFPRQAPQGAGMPDGMAQLKSLFPIDEQSGDIASGMSRLQSAPGLENVSDLQGLANLARLDGAKSSGAVQGAIASGDLETVLSLGKVASLPGVRDAADLDQLEGIVQSAGIDGIGSLADVGRLTDQLPISSAADIASLPAISGNLGISDLGGLGELGSLTRLGGFNSLADVGKVGALAKIPGVSTLTGIAGGNPQAAIKSLSTLASCAGASTPVTSAMIDSAGMVGAFQAVSNTLGGPGGRDVQDIKVAPSTVKLPATSLPKSQAPLVSEKIQNGSPDVTAYKRELAAKSYGTSRLNKEKNKIKAQRAANRRRTAVITYARALERRARLAMETEQRLAQLEAKLPSGASVADDIRFNSRLRIELTQRVQELTELTSHWLQLRAAHEVYKDPETMLQPSMAAHPVGPRPPTSDEKSEKRQAAVIRSKRFRQAVEDAADAHNANVDTAQVEDHLPKLREIVSDHETRKDHLVGMEREIRSHLSNLYVDPDRAWQTLKSDLISYDGTGYLDANKWANGAAAARSAIPAVLAQQPSTRYGQRIPSECNAYGSGLPSYETYCPPYTTGPVTSTSGRSAINGHYSGYERYQARTRLRAPSGKDDTGSSAREDALYQSLQYYLEARKRKQYWDKMRRGSEDRGGMTTTADLWNELSERAPNCIAGPLEPTADNMRARPDLFDIAPDCEHRTWSRTGFKDMLISHLQLGGVDQSIWMIENAKYENEAINGGREGVLAHVQAARDIHGGDLEDALKDHNRAGLAADVKRLVDALDTIEGDDASQTRVEVARR